MSLHLFVYLTLHTSLPASANQGTSLCKNHVAVYARMLTGAPRTDGVSRGVHIRFILFALDHTMTSQSFVMYTMKQSSSCFTRPSLYGRLYTMYKKRTDLPPSSPDHRAQKTRANSSTNATILGHCLPMIRYTEENIASVLEMAVPKQTSAMGRKRVAGLDG